MKKLLVFLSLTFILLATTACSNSNVTSQEITRVNENTSHTSTVTDSYMLGRPPQDIKKAVTSFPSEKSSLNVEKFKNDFYESSYYDEDLNYKDFYNYMPEDISREYNMDAFEFLDSKNRYHYFLWCDGLIVRANSFPASSESDSAYVHFAISDLNSDGHYELISSFSMQGSRYHFTYLTMIDTHSRQFVKSLTIYNEYAYFKVDDQNNLSVYTGSIKDIDRALLHYTDFLLNIRTYEFRVKELSLESETFSVEISINENYIHFPFYFKGLQLNFLVTTKMTYLGPTFSYLNTDTYLDGVLVTFKNEEAIVNMEGWLAGSAMTPFTIETGQVIEKTYSYYDSINQANVPGTYDILVSYRGDVIKVDDFLTIK